MATFEHLLLESKEREEKLAKKLKSLQQKYGILYMHNEKKID